MERVVIGTDGSAYAAEALRWGVAEAAVHGARVEVVAVTGSPKVDSASAVVDERDDDSVESRASLDRWVTETLGNGAEPARVLLHGDPVQELLARSVDADLLVVGARGTGGFKGLLMGSVSQRLVELSTPPVAVVREGAPVEAGRVVVGYDGSPAAREALHWAAEEARARGATLDVVHAWQIPAAAASPWVIVPQDQITDSSREIMEEALADPALEGLTVDSHIHHGSPPEAILERAQAAQLVVMGTRGMGRVASAILGSVSRQVLHHTDTPVVVV